MWWWGNTSRDQYQGVVLGYSLAYTALKSPKHRKLIRDDMVAMATELLKKRKVPTTIRYKFGGKWHNLDLDLDLQYTILNPTEYVDGKVYIQVGSDGDSSNYGDSTMLGMRCMVLVRLPDAS